MKAKPYPTLDEVAKKVLKSKRNTVFVNTEQVKNCLNILKRMKILKVRG